MMDKPMDKTRSQVQAHLKKKKKKKIVITPAP